MYKKKNLHNLNGMDFDIREYSPINSRKKVFNYYFNYYLISLYIYTYIQISIYNSEMVLSEDRNMSMRKGIYPSTWFILINIYYSCYVFTNDFWKYLENIFYR